MSNLMTHLYFGQQLNCWPKNNPCYLYLATERDRDRETDREAEREKKKREKLNGLFTC